MREDIEHAWNGPRLYQIHPLEAALGGTAGDQIRECNVAHRHVGGKSRFARDFQAGIVAPFGKTHIGFRFGSGNRHCQISIAPAWFSARTSVSLPSSTLNALCS